MVTPVRKVVCYAVQQGHLLVFTHKDVPLEITGVQVPAGTIRPGEEAAAAAVRELHEETGRSGRVLR
ncbi:NUDIX domain-containing protein [Arthrobacter yangruifuii]|uniref:NUDIX domain-containing protein n=1 Tax=Arthrobacter yangruifuii TaxID=2606616 RepID=UPI001AEE0DDC|nr:NUDIX domain-containing protein [Arthrobacter yangruifuii]